MSQPMTTTECLLDQYRRYPALEPEDLIKALHQSVYGCGHLVGAAEEGIDRIQEEMDRAREDADGIEPLAGAYCRLPLAWARKLGMKAETVFALFAYSARTPSGTAEELAQPHNPVYEGLLRAALQVTYFDKDGAVLLTWDGPVELW